MSVQDLRAGGKPAMARALAQIERRPNAPETTALLDAAFGAPQGPVLGLTGPPGVGKSTLIGAFIREQRARGQTIAVVAVDPSSAISKGALLGDRARFGDVSLDPGVFVRSMASRGRLGGLAALTFPAATLLAAVYDLVIIETVGVGQSEIDIVAFADRTALCVQPGSGDSLQFLKAGIMEIPDVAIVTKGDMGALARRSAADLRSAGRSLRATQFDVYVTCASTGEGVVEALTGAVAGAWPLEEAARQKRAHHWVKSQIRDTFGSFGSILLSDYLNARDNLTPFGRYAEISKDFGELFREKLKVC